MVERVRAEVDRILTQQDPEGLLAMGAPADEYRSEAETLTRVVCAGRADAESVLAVWEHWFGPGSSLLRRPESLYRLSDALAGLSRPGGSGGG